MKIENEHNQPTNIAEELLPLIGGKANILNITHCTTRLRFELKDESKVHKEKIEALNCVHGTFSRLGLFQIILGGGIVNKVYRAILETTPSPEESNDYRIQQRKKMNPFLHLARTLSNIFVPIIPAIVASGLIMGLIGMVKAFQWGASESFLIKMLDIFSSAAFIILPILIGFSAAKEFGGSQVLGAVVGGILTHPSLLNPTKLGYEIPQYINILGFDIPLIGYHGTVIPILLSVFIMSKLEIGFKKIVGNAFQLFFIPFLLILFIGSISIIFIGPLSLFISHIVTTTFEYLYEGGGVIAGFLFGGLYSLLVITGLHHTLHAIEMELLSDIEIAVNFLLPIWSMANVAQGAAALAVFFRTKEERIKKIAIPSAFSAFLGIVEPVIFGINIKLMKPFIGAVFGGALGGAYVTFTHVVANSYGLTGIPMIAIVAPLGMTNLIHYLIGLGIAVSVSFMTTWLLWTVGKSGKRR